MAWHLGIFALLEQDVNPPLCFKHVWAFLFSELWAMNFYINYLFCVFLFSFIFQLLLLLGRDLPTTSAIINLILIGW